MLGIARPNAGGRDPLDRRLPRCPPAGHSPGCRPRSNGSRAARGGCRSHGPWGSSLGGLRVLHALADLPGDEVAGQRIRLGSVRMSRKLAARCRIRARCSAVSQNASRSSGVTSKVPRGSALWMSSRRPRAAVRRVPGSGLDLALLRLGDGAGCAGRATIGGALENGELPDRFGDGLDDLHPGRPGADDRDALAREADRLMGPAIGVEGLAAESSRPPGCGAALAESGPSAVIRKRAAKRSPFSSTMFQCRAASLKLAATTRLLNRISRRRSNFGDVVQVAQVSGCAAKCSLQFHSCSSSSEKE